MLIQRTVPRDVVKGGKRDRWTAGPPCPHSHPFKQCSTHSVALRVGKHADLFHVSVSVKSIGQDVAQRLTGSIDRDPASSGDRIRREVAFRRRFMIRHRRHPNRTESFPCLLLNRSEQGALLRAGWTDSDHPDILARPTHLLRTVAEAPSRKLAQSAETTGCSLPCRRPGPAFCGSSFNQIPSER